MDASVLSALASPRRREILRLIWDQELSAGSIHQAMPDVTFGAVSLQLKALRDAGLLTGRSVGRQRLYLARRTGLGPIAEMLEQMWDDRLWSLKLAVELDQSRRGPRRRNKRRRP
jgi:DNA-binding transcriptional ArsR family regulator